MQVLKDEIRHKILLEAELLFLQKGYDRTTLQMIADKVNISKSAPMLADEDNSMLLAQIMARNLIDGMVMVLKNRVRPREIRTNLNRLVEYHTKGIDVLLK